MTVQPTNFPITDYKKLILSLQYTEKFHKFLQIIQVTRD